MARRWIVELSFLLVLAAGLAVIGVQAFDLRFEARLFPLIWLGLAAVLVVVQTLVVLVRGRRAAAGEVISEGFETDFGSRDALGRTVRLAAWVVGIIAGIWLFGVILGVSVGTFAYVRIEGGLSWIRAAALGALSLGYLWLVLVIGLGMKVFEGGILFG